MGYSKYWRHLKSVDFADIDRDKTVVILPLAAIEQHGPHLPLDVDCQINEGILKELVENAPVSLPFLILPAQCIGYSAEHTTFPGTLSYSPSMSIDLWISIASQVISLGFSRLILFNSHGGNSDLMRVVLRQLRAKYQVAVVAASWYRMVELEKFVNPAELEHGIHGGFIETSLMLHLAPESVDMAKATYFRSAGIDLAKQNMFLSATGKIQLGWMTQDLNAAGAVGDASNATAEIGLKLMASASKSLIQLITEVSSFDLKVLCDEIG